MHLCGRIVLVARFLPELCPEILAHMGCALVAQNVE